MLLLAERDIALGQVGSVGSEYELLKQRLKFSGAGSRGILLCGETKQDFKSMICMWEIMSGQSPRQFIELSRSEKRNTCVSVCKWFVTSRRIMMWGWNMALGCEPMDLRVQGCIREGVFWMLRS